MIIGVGVDLVDINRFENHLEKTPGLKEKIFHADEREVSINTLAGRFAAKEALVKAFGGSLGMHWHDVRVSKDEHGKPEFNLFDATADLAANKGISKLHLSISHDGGMATAFVIAEGNA
jgi:holo-[acyl-carrier protein] synthase